MFFTCIGNIQNAGRNEENSLFQVSGSDFFSVLEQDEYNMV